MKSPDWDEFAERGMLLLSKGVKGREAFKQIAKLAFERGQRMTTHTGHATAQPPATATNGEQANA